MTDATIVQSDEDVAVAPQVANSPFDDQNADLILRASDNVDFYVHKILLSLVSPFFQDMFSLPQSPNRKAGEVKKDGDREFPVAAAPENSPVLAGLLVWVDPRCNPVLGTMDDLGDVLQAADNTSWPVLWFELDLLSSIQRLYEYHAACGDAAYYLANPTIHNNFRWENAANAPWKGCLRFDCHCKAEGRGHGEGLEWSSISVWWLDYMKYCSKLKPANRPR
ncbi:hypothetical protein B0H11DRAFT_1981373 [Mycena galericulata]|nr:hypothetical protein B0H11DRAFT_1981373 [Mycena galericulata]